MKKILLLSFLLMSFCVHHAMAQSRTVTGTVTDASTNQPLPGVTVLVKGTQIGTATSADGKYSIDVPQANNTLVFRFVGYDVTERAIGSSNVLNVSLGVNTKQLSEVVVTGYTTQNQREVTGSVSTVKADEIKQAPLGSFDQALQGRAPGILVQSNSGQPGAAANVVIRGSGSIIGNNAPLYVVDGVQISANDFATINPSDFATYTLLKDASATSIYGSRGANGVIVITTKKGVAGATRISYDGQHGFSTTPENRLPVMNTAEKLEYELANGNPYGWTDAQLARLRTIDTNWEDVFFRTGTTKSHTLNASGGSEKTTFFLSGSLFDQTGTVRNTGLERYTGRVNVESNAGNFNFGVNSTFGVSDFKNTTETNSAISSPLNAIRWSNPYETPYDEDGNYTQQASGQPNALQELLENSNLRKQLKGIGNVFINYDVPFVEGLKLGTTWGGDFTSNETEAYVEPNTYTALFTVGRAGSFGRGYFRRFRYTGTTSAIYDFKLGEEHKLSIALFNEIINTKSRNFGFTGYGLRGPFQNESGITPGTSDNGFIPGVSGSGSESALLSYFTNINYGFRDRYFLTVGARRDGSSRFGADRKFANFGSVGFSWILTDEDFMQSLSDIFDEVKFKASYGSAGNQALESDFASRELYRRAAYGGASGLEQYQLANEFLQWERRTTFNTGLEFTALNGRIGATVEFYNSITSDLFLDYPLSRTSGYEEIAFNVGELRNRGVELALNGYIIQTDDFNWNLNVSFTRNQNEVLSLIGAEKQIGDGLFVNRIGEPINSIFVVRYAGVNPDNGNPQYLDRNGEITEIYDPNDRVVVGSSQAPFFGGFGTTLNFKGIEVSSFFSFVTGNKLYNNDRANIENPLYIFDNLSKDLLNEWRTPGQITNIPRPDAPFQSSTTHFVEDGDFLRLRNLTISYSLPTQLTDNVGIKNIRVFAQGQNLVTWTKFRGFDPEITGGSLVGAQYPALRTLTFGLNLGF